MSDQSGQTVPTQTFDDVFRNELALIAARRNGATPESTDSGDPRKSFDRAKLEQELTGLALSGGGVRSAAFNLGLLQALYDKDLLRQIDYLSTVSGGGYVGAHLSSLAAHPESRFKWEEPSVPVTNSASANANSTTNAARQTTDPHNEPLATHVSERTRETNPVQETLGAGKKGIRETALGKIAQRCRYLSQPSHFLNRQLIGAFCLNTVTISGLIALAALAAWSFRALDSVPVMQFLDNLKIRSDVFRAMLPAIGLFGLWLMCWAISFFRDRDNAHGAAAKVVLVLWVAAALLGIAALAGSGDIAPDPAYLKKYNLKSDEITQYFKQFGWAALIAIGGSLLPYLHPRALLRSATNQKGVQGFIYRAATTSMLFGVPLVMFWYMAREDFAGTNQSQKGQILSDEVQRLIKKEIPPTEMSTVNKTDKWKELFNEVFRMNDHDLKYNTVNDLHQVSIKEDGTKFWERIAISASLKDEVAGVYESGSRRIPAFLAKRLKDARDAANRRTKLDPQDSSRSREENLESESFFSLAFSCARWLTGEDGTLFESQLKSSIDIANGNTAIAAQINFDVLADAKLCMPIWKTKDSWKSLEGNATEFQKEDRRQLQRMVESAKCFDEELCQLRDEIELKLFRRNGYSLHKFAAMLPMLIVPDLFPDLLLKGLNDSNRVEDVMLAAIIEDAQKLPPSDLRDVKKNIHRLVKLGEEIRANNRSILNFFCGPELRAPSVVFATIVQPEDQKVRWRWAMVAGGIWVLLSGLVSLNGISLQGVYRDALSRAWVLDPSQQHGGSMSLYELRQVATRGCPYHLITGAMSYGASWGFAQIGAPFLFSPLYCGSETTGYVRSSRYSSGNLTLADAMAISGAAVAPIQIQDPLGRILLTLANFRMGTWLPNPLKPCWHIELDSLPIIPRMLLKIWAKYPQTPGRVYLQWILWQWFLPKEQTPFLYLSDGGHYENLGIGELLKRRCRLIIVSDAGEDSKYTFEDFVCVVHAWSDRIRIDAVDQPAQQQAQSEKQSVEPDFNIGSLTDRRFHPLLPRSKTSLSDKHFVVMKIEYLDDGRPDGEHTTGHLIYIKPTLTGDEDPGLRGFRSLNAEFPHDPTANQLFEDDKFEAYRRLGYHTGEKLADELGPPSASQFWLGTWQPPAVPAQASVKADTTSSTNEKRADDQREIPHSLNELIDIACHSSREILERLYAIRELADDGSEHATNILRQLLNDPDSELAHGVLTALAMTSKREITLLPAALASRHLGVRVVALRLINDQLNHDKSKNANRDHTEILFAAIETLISQKGGEVLLNGELTLLKEAMNALAKYARHADDSKIRLRVEKLLKSVIENLLTHRGMRKAAERALHQIN